MAGITIYILHGWSIVDNNVAKWEPFQQELKTAGYKTVFVPLPGLDSQLSSPWSLDNYVEHIAQIITKNKSKDGKTVVLGHSFGGQVGIRLCANYQNLVDGLILIDSAGLRDNNFLPKAKRLVFYTLAKIGNTLGFKSNKLRQIVHNLARVHDYYEANQVMKKTMANVVSQEVRTDLSNVIAPTKIIWGSGDKVTPIWMANYFHQHIKNSQLSIVNGARHSPQFTHHVATSTLITRFLKENL